MHRSFLELRGGKKQQGQSCAHESTRLLTREGIPVVATLSRATRAMLMIQCIDPPLLFAPSSI